MLILIDKLIRNRHAACRGSWLSAASECLGGPYKGRPCAGLTLVVVGIRGRVTSRQAIAMPLAAELRGAQAPPASAVTETGASAGGRAAAPIRFVSVGAASGGLRSWPSPLILIAISGVGGGLLAGGLPAGISGASTVGLLAVAATLSDPSVQRRLVEAVVRGEHVGVLGIQPDDH
jgi:hypothetical protein